MTRYEIENKRIILRIKRGLDLRQTLMELAKREVRGHRFSALFLSIVGESAQIFVVFTPKNDIFLTKSGKVSASYVW